MGTAAVRLVRREGVPAGQGSGVFDGRIKRPRGIGVDREIRKTGYGAGSTL